VTPDLFKSALAKFARTSLDCQRVRRRTQCGPSGGEAGKGHRSLKAEMPQRVSAAACAALELQAMTRERLLAHETARRKQTRGRKRQTSSQAHPTHREKWRTLPRSLRKNFLAETCYTAEFISGSATFGAAFDYIKFTVL